MNAPLRSHTGGSRPSPLLGVAKAVGGVVKRRKHVVLLGLDGSGKTTILLRLRYGCYVATTATIGFNHEKVWCGGFRWSVWDVGGGERLRPLWSTYARATDGVVFVVDASAASDIMEEARVELAKVVKASRATAAQLSLPVPPFLVLANFQDRSFARNPEEVASCLGLAETWAGGITWAIAPTCGLSGEGLDCAMATLRSLIDRSRHEDKRKDKRTHRWR